MKQRYDLTGERIKPGDLLIYATTAYRTARMQLGVAKTFTTENDEVPVYMIDIHEDRETKRRYVNPNVVPGSGRATEESRRLLISPNKFSDVKDFDSYLRNVELMINDDSIKDKMRRKAKAELEKAQEEALLQKKVSRIGESYLI